MSVWHLTYYIAHLNGGYWELHNEWNKPKLTHHTLLMWVKGICNGHILQCGFSFMFEGHIWIPFSTKIIQRFDAFIIGSSQLFNIAISMYSVNWFQEGITSCPFICSAFLWGKKSGERKKKTVKYVNLTF